MQIFISFYLLTVVILGGSVNKRDICIYDRTSVENSKLKRSNEKAAEFELKDQYNKSFSLKFPKEKVTVLVFGDREGAQQIESWVRPLVQKYTDKIDILGVAELSAVPGIAKGLVRGVMKNKVKYSVILDWSGEVSKSYGYQKGKANLFVVDRDGRISAKATDAATEDQLENIVRDINRIL